MDNQIESLRKQLPRRERRLIEGSAETRAAEGDSGPKIAMRIPYNKRSETLFGFVEVIKPSAFLKTLQERGSDVVALWNHDPNWPLGRQSNRMLAVTNDDQALEGVVELDAADPMHQHFARRVERRDVKGASFGFETVRDTWIKEADGTLLRELVEVRLFDLSPVTFPAYPDSDAEKRSQAVFDIASVRAGGDLAALASVLVRAEGGKVPAEDAAEVRAWLARLTSLLPVEPVRTVPRSVRERDLVLRARLAELRAA